MLVNNEDSDDTFIIIGIDPGSTHLGVSAITVNVDTMKIISSIAWTIDGEKLMPKHSRAEEIHGTRYVRIKALGKELERIFFKLKPLFVASESPFYNQRRPQAYGVLTEVICAIRNALINYLRDIKLKLIDPPTIKISVGAKGNADKDTMKRAVLLKTELNYNGAIPIIDLDEHSIDALAVAYCYYLQIMESLCKDEFLLP